MLFILFLIVHLAVSLLVYLGIESRKLKVHRYMFFVVLCLPIWGLLIVLVLHFQIWFEADDSIDVGVEKLKMESELYKSLTIEEKKGQNIIPIEEALLINSPRERRELIMDVLNDNPKEYVEFLQKAGNNEDTEVVHYAVTAMVEISKENDYLLQEFERQYVIEPDNPVLLEKYCDFLWSCLVQNLMQGQVEMLNRELFSTLLQKKIAVRENITDYVRLIENELKRKNYTLANEYLRQMNTAYPKREEYYLLRVQYLAALGRGEDIKKLLTEIAENQVFLSSKSKEVLAFWEH